MKQTKIIILISAVAVFAVGIFLINLYTGNKIEPDKENVSEQNETNDNNINTQYPPIAGKYCRMLGYGFRINETKEGQVGMCIFPDGSECDNWAFYRGKCGQEWSYCKLNGYGLKNLSRIEGWDSGAICIKKDTGGEIGTVSDLMNLTAGLVRPVNSTLPP